MTVLVHITPTTGAVLNQQPEERIAELANAIASGRDSAAAKKLERIVRTYVSDLTSAAHGRPDRQATKPLETIISELESLFCAYRLRDREPIDRVAQPSGAAIAARYVKPFRKHLAKLFGYKIRPFGDFSDADYLRSLDGWEGFASTLFWEEIDSIIRRELKPNLDEMFLSIAAVNSTVNVVLDSPYQGDWATYREANRSRLFSIEANRGKPHHYHCICRVHEKDQTRFRQSVADGLPVDSMRDFVKIVSSCPDFLFAGLKRKQTHENWWAAIVNFSDELKSNNTVEFHSAASYKYLYTDDYFPDGEGENIPTDDNSKNLSADERLELLDRFVAEQPGKPISGYARQLFPELTSPKYEPPPLPTKAPERWPSDPDKRMENPAQFATRVYRKWMDAEVLTRSDLERLDPLLLSSLDSWQQNNKKRARPEALPEGFRLLTIGQANDLWIERVRKGDAPFPVGDELKRFASALHNRVLSDGKREK